MTTDYDPGEWWLRPREQGGIVTLNRRTPPPFVRSLNGLRHAPTQGLVFWWEGGGQLWWDRPSIRAETLCGSILVAHPASLVDRLCKLCERKLEVS